jgi:thiosulfate reductase cytochrome b subunit
MMLVHANLANAAIPLRRTILLAMMAMLAPWVIIAGMAPVMLDLTPWFARRPINAMMLVHANLANAAIPLRRTILLAMMAMLAPWVIIAGMAPVIPEARLLL